MLIRLLVGRVSCYEFGSEFPGSKCIVFDSQRVDPTWNEKVAKMDLTSDPFISFKFELGATITEL